MVPTRGARAHRDTRPLLFALLVALSTAEAVNAAVFPVTDTASFQAALYAASTNPGADELSLQPPGVVIPLALGLTYHPGTGDPFGNDGSSVTIEGNGGTLLGPVAGLPLLSIDTTGVADAGATITLRNLTLTGGTQGGLVVVAASASVVLETFVASNNSLVATGGWAIVGGGGGAIATLAGGSVTVSGCQFQGNTVTLANPVAYLVGGGLAVFTLDGNIVLSSSVFAANTLSTGASVAGIAGGGGAGLLAATGVVEVTGCEFSANQATIATDTGGGGGFAAIIFTGSLTLSLSSFHDNTVEGATGDADLGGGGAAVDGGEAAVLVTTSRFVGNSVTATGPGGDAAGGGLVLDGLDGDFVVSDSVFSGNLSSATQDTSDEYVTGGGLEVRSYDGSISVVNNTAVGNRADSSFVALGGGISVTLGSELGSAQVYNNIARGNMLSGSLQGVAGGADVSINTDYNENGVGAAAGLFNNDLGVNSNFANPLDPASTDLMVTDLDNYTEGANTTADPLLSADFHLLAGSPCIDTGTNAAPSLPALDFDGDPRVVDGNVDGTATADIGADEALPADLTIAKSDGGSTVLPGGTVAYALTFANVGGLAATGAALTETVPANTTFNAGASTSGWVCAPNNQAGATCTMYLGLYGAGGGPSVAIFAVTLVNAVPAGVTQITNTASIAASGAPDPTPANNSATDTTTILFPADVAGTKTVAGDFRTGTTATYTVVLTNSGPAAQLDNPGDEFSDILPASLALASATATSGTALANLVTNTVTWNGTISAGGSVTITISATVVGTFGQTISNQGTCFYDLDGNGTNEASEVTDDPAGPGAADPTTFVVAANLMEIPTLSGLGLALLALALAGAARVRLRRRTA